MRALNAIKNSLFAESSVNINTTKHVHSHINIRAKTNRCLTSFPFTYIYIQLFKKNLSIFVHFMYYRLVEEVEHLRIIRKEIKILF